MKILHFLEQDLLIWTYFANLSSGKSHNSDRKGENVADTVAELKEIEATYKALFDRTLLSILVVDLKGNFLDANETALRLLGYTRTEIPSLHVYNVLNQDQLPIALKATEEVLKYGFLKNPVEIKLRKKDGDELWVEAEAALIYRVGIPISILGIAHDITERKRAEETFRESEEKYRVLVQNANEAMIVVQEGKLEFANPKTTELTGYSKEELISRAFVDFVHPDDREVVATHHLRRRRGEPLPQTQPFRIIDKAGHIKWVQIHTVLIHWGGNPAILNFLNDITERKQAEKDLQAEKQRFQMLLENAPFGMVLVDRHGIFEYINHKFTELFGYDLKDVPNGREWFRKAFPAPSYRHQAILTWIDDSKSLEPKEKIPRTFVVTCKDKTEKTVRFITVQLESGEYLMSTEDITLLKRAETEKAALEEQLRQSQRIEAIGRLAGGVAHDFNNLMMVIRGYSQLSVAELKEGDKLRGNLEEIQKATQRATDLTRQLLAFSRRQILEFKVLDLNSLIRDLEKMLRRVIGEDIELVTRLAEDLGRVKTDPGQIEQVVMNLAVNARDSMPRGGKLMIETKHVELDEGYTRTHVGVKPGRYVMFSVSDTGVGMSPEVKEHLFEPFFTTKEMAKGTGLGLSTVYGIVKQSGGDIWFYSEPGKGTTFKVFLPRVDEPLEEISESTVVDEIPSGCETILAVEDEDNVRRLAVQILKGQGYFVLEASHAEEAMKVVKEQTENGIHLLLTDVVMPGMSGHELANHLLSSLPKMKVLFMSGYTDNAIVHHGILEEGVNYIQKPFTVDALARKVREVLDR